MPALFTKTYEELRDAFVRGRFGEEQEFGNEDVERWLEGQRKADKPDGDGNESPWHHYMTLDAMLFSAQGNELTILRRYAEPLTQIPTAECEYEEAARDRERIAPLLQSFDDAKAKLYYGHLNTIIIVCNDRPEPRAFTIKNDRLDGTSCLVIKAVHSVDVIDAIFATWLRGGPRAANARDFLCRKLGEVIAKSRATAEADFDRAVAVSPDGKKIVHAEEVIVIDEDNTRHRFAPAAFSKLKIKRVDGFFSNCVVPEFAANVEYDARAKKLVVRTYDRYGIQWLLFVPTGKSKQGVLITPRRFCPEPLPAEELR